MPEQRNIWIYRLKRQTLAGILGVLAVTVIATIALLAYGLMNESKQRNRELGRTIVLGLKSLMLRRAAIETQETLENIAGRESTLINAYILDTEGTVIYSSRKEDLGMSMQDSCKDCHIREGRPPEKNTIITGANGQRAQRSVILIRNEEGCWQCHLEEKVLGMLMIDRSLEGTYSIIGLAVLIILSSGAVLVIFTVPFLSKKVDRYINEITSQGEELSLLNMMIERLSKTIETETLKRITIDVLKNVVGADWTQIVMPRHGNDYRVTLWRRSNNEIVRKKIEKDDPLLPYIDRWLKGGLLKPEVSPDGMRAYLPVVKNGDPLALLYAACTERRLQHLGLLPAICLHAAVAFENSRLYTLAITDELTRLYTRRHMNYVLEIKLSEAAARRENLTLFMLDIDDFKRINDTYGHPAGDAVLEGIADCMMRSIRETDLAFRYGGEEFSVILLSMDSAKAEWAAERLRTNIEKCAVEFGETDLKVTVSIGTATFPADADNSQSLIEKADHALYLAKQAGKNRVVVSPAGV